MNYNHEPRVTVDILFPCFKQGDDFASCGGDLNTFANLHREVVSVCENINALIPESAKEYVTGDGDTHSCWLNGPKSVMVKLVKAGLASNYDDEDDDYMEA